MKLKLLFSAAAALAVTAAAHAAPGGRFTVSLESEAAGAQNTSAGFTAVGVETFEAVGTGNNLGFVTNFGGSAFTGTYSGVDVLNADQYGGAGGSGRYAVTFSDTGYALDLTTSLPGGVTYFGFWLSALDGGNNVTFFQNGNQLFTFNAAAAKSFIDSLPGAASYYGNPNSAFAGQNGGEPYAFLNFYARGNTRFDRVVFSESPMGGGYESDNHTVGRWNRISGTVVPVPGSSGAVPEPSSWLLLIAGFGLVGTGMRRRRLVAA